MCSDKASNDSLASIYISSKEEGEETEWAIEHVRLPAFGGVECGQSSFMCISIHYMQWLQGWPTTIYCDEYNASIFNSCICVAFKIGQNRVFVQNI